MSTEADRLSTGLKLGPESLSAADSGIFLNLPTQRGVIMKITKTQKSIREVYAGFEDSDNAGVVAYDGKLDIRPPYQREFVYNEKRQRLVIQTVTNGLPLGVMFWNKKEEDGFFEVLDGQQRLLSLCFYLAGKFCYPEDSKNGVFFHNLAENLQEKFLDYKLDVYICEGKPNEKINWFRTINVAGLVLTEQEMRNAMFAGPWVSDAKKWFSKPGCVAYVEGGDLVKGELNRQAFLHTAIEWHADAKGRKPITYIG